MIDDHDPRKRHQQEVGLFRFGLIADLVHLPPGTPGLYRKLREKAACDYQIPGTTRTRVAAETMRGWLRAYRTGGFDALLPNPRSDAGRSRALPQEVADLLVAVKEERRDLSIKQVIREARASGKVPDETALPISTVHRLLAGQGLMHKPAETPRENDRMRFSFEKAGELWMSDVMHGPAVPRPGGKKKGKTYLIAFIDDATRVVPYARFEFAESTKAFLPVFEQAVLRRGIPKRLYVDNGAAYRSHHLALVCAKLGTALIHARPYQPQAKGKIERWFRTVRMQLLPLLNSEDTRSIEALNRRLWGYIEGEYHHAPHRGLGGETPLDRWARSADEVHYPGPDIDLDDLFLFEAQRKVQKDRTASLDGVLFEVDAALVGQKVTLRFDPARPRGPVQVWHQGRYVHDAKVVDAYANCFVKRNRPSCTPTPVEQHTVAADPADVADHTSPPTPSMRLADLAQAVDVESDETNPGPR